MASERFRELLSGLEEATRDKKVRWSETAKETAFRIAFGKGLVRIESHEGDEGEWFVAYLQDRSGRTVDEAYHREYQSLDALYRLARASALHIDDVLDSMLADLKEGKTAELPDDKDKPDKDDIPF